MPDKQNCDIEFRYKNGFFRRFSAVAPLQLYQLNEREIHHTQPLDKPLNSDNVQILMCISGEGTLASNDSIMSLRKDTVIFIGDVSREYTVSADGNEGAFRYALMDLAFFETLEPSIHSAVYTFFANNKNMLQCSQKKIANVISQLIAELCLPTPMTSRVRDLLDQALIYIYRLSVPKEYNSMTNEPSVNAVGHTVYAIIRYIDDNLYSIHSLMEMAEKLGYSYNYLSHLFRRKTGMTIQNYFAQKKIDASRELLSDNQYSITEISTMLNYDCIQSFSKAFKKAMGMSPTEFRSMHSKKQ